MQVGVRACITRACIAGAGAGVLIPRPTRYLERLARQLGEQVAPRLPTPYEQAGMLREPLHVHAVRVEFERAAHRRVQENTAIRSLLARAARLEILAIGLRNQCAQAAATRDDDLRVSALQASNDSLRHMLIQLHEALENDTRDPEAQTLLDDLWRELARSTERRRLPSDRF